MLVWGNKEKSDGLRAAEVLQYFRICVRESNPNQSFAARQCMEVKGLIVVENKMFECVSLIFIALNCYIFKTSLFSEEKCLL